MNQREMEMQLWAYLASHMRASTFDELVQWVLPSFVWHPASDDVRFSRAIQNVIDQLDRKALPR